MPILLLYKDAVWFDKLARDMNLKAYTILELVHLPLVLHPHLQNFYMITYVILTWKVKENGS